MTPAFISELFVFLVPTVVFGGVWLCPPLIAYRLGNLLYAAYARAVGIPKPEQGYDLFDVLGGWLVAAFLAWTWVAYRLLGNHRQTVDGWVEAVDRLVL